MRVESDAGIVFAAVPVALKNPDLIEGRAKVDAAEGLILVELQTILVVQMHGPQLLLRDGKFQLIRRIKAGQNAMGALDDAADAAWIIRHVSKREDMAGGRQVGDIHWLIRLRLNGKADVGMMSEHLVGGFGEVFEGAGIALGFANIGSFACEPENDELSAHGLGNVNRLQGTVNRVLAILRAIAGIAAINRPFAEPKARRDHLHEKPLSLDLFPDFRWAALFVSMSGTISSSWNITASKPPFLKRASFHARSLAGRVSGP